MNDALLPDHVLDSIANAADRPADGVINAIAQQLVSESSNPESDEPTNPELDERRAAFLDLLREVAREEGPVEEFLAAGAELDDCIDPKLVHRAQAFFEEHGVAIITALFHAALPEAYLGRRGVQVLDMTGELVSNWTRRIQETGQFLVNVLSPSPEFEGSGTTTLTHGELAARAVRRVRLRHSAVRWLLQAPYKPTYKLLFMEGLRDPRLWDLRMQQIDEDRTRTEPLNQEDLLATLGTFTTVTFEALAKMGVAFDDDDREAFYHLWNVVGWHLGIGDVESVGDIDTGAGAGRWPNNAILPLGAPRMDDLVGRLRQRLQGQTEAGPRLAKALVQELSYPLPRPTQGAPAFFVRYLIGDEHADQLEIGAGGYVQLLVRRTGALASVAKRARVNPLGELMMSALSHTVTRYALRAFVAQSRGSERGFSIDPRIANQWGIQTGPEVQEPLRA
jgi:hypothetical protein